MIILRDDPSSDKIAFFELGMQYYIAGRASYLSFLMPVSGNLFHRAIEMMLKAGLIGKYPPKDLWKVYGHKLPIMWQDFKELFPQEKLARFDSFVNKLNGWEDLRYPRKTGSDVAILFALEKGKQPKIQKVVGRESKDYMLILEESDEFFKCVMKPLDVNPDYAKQYILTGFDERLNNYKKFNKHSVLESDL